MDNAECSSWTTVHDALAAGSAWKSQDQRGLACAPKRLIYVTYACDRRLKLLRALGPLTVTIISIAIMNIWGLMKAPASIRVVGTIPKGLPGSTVSMFSPIHDFPSKIGLAIVVCLIDILESISIARALALKGKYDIRYSLPHASVAKSTAPC